MKKNKWMIFLTGMILSILITACNTKEAVMLNTEFGVSKCESVSDEVLQNQNEQNIEIEAEESLGTQIYVYICGEVQNPGVYMMKESARVYEVLMEAGGYTIEADEEAMNLAELVSDGLQIYIPKKNENSLETVTNVDDGLININEATEMELQEIPGVGSVKAQKIIEYRTEYGKFTKNEDIMKVEGIKTGTYEKIKEYIRVD